MKDAYDVCVIGLGSMGSAISYYLAKAGAKVLGIEQFTGVHDHGSHSGETRLIRKAYFEHPDYVPLLERAYINWKEHETLTGEKIYYETGLFYAGPPAHNLMTGVRKSADIYNLRLEEKNYNIFSLPNDYESVFEPQAGFILAEKAISNYHLLAKNLGSDLLFETRVKGYEWKNGMFSIRTGNDTYTTKKIILAAGAWTSDLIKRKLIKLEVTEQWLAWAEPANPEEFSLEKFPSWGVIDEKTNELAYGFPLMPDSKYEGLKIAIHKHAKSIEPDKKSAKTYSKDDADEILEVCSRIFPGRIKKIKSMRSCLYTYSPDEHFVIDFHPDNQDIIIVAGFSGHGFKFSSAVGEAVSELALEMQTTYPIDFLSLDRLK